MALLRGVLHWIATWVIMAGGKARVDEETILHGSGLGRPHGILTNSPRASRGSARGLRANLGDMRCLMSEMARSKYR